MNEWLTVSEVSKETNIPVETARRYIRKYGEYLNLKRGEKRSYLVNRSNLETLAFIRDRLENGMQHKQLLAELSGFTQYIDVKEDKPEPVTRQDIDELKSMLTDQQAFNEKLLERLDQQHDYFTRQVEELKKENQALIEADKKPWYKRIF